MFHWIYSISIFFIWEVQEIIVQKTKKWPKKSAAFGGGLLVPFWDLKYNNFLDFQNKKYRYWVYLMEHICFEVQLCIKISIFSEFCENSYIYHPTLSYSLQLNLTRESWGPIIKDWGPKHKYKRLRSNNKNSIHKYKSLRSQNIFDSNPELFRFNFQILFYISNSFIWFFIQNQLKIA